VLIHGTNGCGKKTILKISMREIYGLYLDKISISRNQWVIRKSEKKFNKEIEFISESSIYHIIMNLFILNKNINVIFKEFIIEMASNKFLCYVELEKISYIQRLLVFENFDYTSLSIQQSLRRTMEINYKG